MRQLKNLFLGLLTLSMFTFIACDDDDNGGGGDFDRPEVTAPDKIQIAVGESGTADFEISFDSDLTATYEVTGDGVTIDSDDSGDATNGTLSVEFTADDEGAGSITVSVSDSEGQDDDATVVIEVGDVFPEVRLTTNITEDTEWTNDNIYILANRISVESGATLTIEEGTVIKGEAGGGANATALLVARGATIMAEGTEDRPIIFTSVADEITPADIEAGNYASPNLEPSQNGLWGGVLILGEARISASNENGDDVTEVQIEGIPTSDQNGLYGGTNDDDDSGVFTYVSIRHGGTNIGAGNEINGLTLGGVGRNTTIENIEIVANQDDGIEWFGGTVDVTNAVVWNAGDDGMDTDQSWAGTCDNFVVVSPTGHNFELDGPEGSYEAGHTFINGTVRSVFAGRTSEDLVNTDGNSIVDLVNIHIQDIGAGQVINRTTDNPDVSWDNVTLDIPSGDLADYIGDSDMVPSGISEGGSPQADVSVFGWTWANEAGGLDGI